MRAMLQAGFNTNSSQFFITFEADMNETRVEETFHENERNIIFPQGQMSLAAGPYHDVI